MVKANAKGPYLINWRPLAEADLDQIIDYIAADNPLRAERFGQELRAQILLLRQHPNMGRKGRPNLPDFVRELVVHQNYIVFYRVLPAARSVVILRIKHVAQDLASARL